MLWGGGEAVLSNLQEYTTLLLDGICVFKHPERKALGKFSYQVIMLQKLKKKTMEYSIIKKLLFRCDTYFMVMG